MTKAEREAIGTVREAVDYEQTTGEALTSRMDLARQAKRYLYELADRARALADELDDNGMRELTSAEKQLMRLASAGVAQRACNDMYLAFIVGDAEQYEAAEEEMQRVLLVNPLD